MLKLGSHRAKGEKQWLAIKTGYVFVLTSGGRTAGLGLSGASTATLYCYLSNDAQGN